MKLDTIYPPHTPLSITAKLLFLTGIIILALAGCPQALNEEDEILEEEENGDVSITVATAEQWLNAVETIRTGGDNRSYVITIVGDFEAPDVPNYSFGSGNTFGEVSNLSVFLKGTGTITVEQDSFLQIWKNQFVTLDGEITLKGFEDNSYAWASLVQVSTEGSFTLENGTISGSNRGVYVSGGTFTMNGGTISGNSTGVMVDVSPYEYGSNVERVPGSFIMNGGIINGNNNGVGVDVDVYVDVDNSFTMNDGTISGNNGNGVYVQGNGTFTMNSGTIKDNSCGVNVAGTFTMNGGTISSNSSSYHGGGVNVSFGTFTMNGGTISGNSTNNDGGGVYIVGTFTMEGGTISGNSANNGGGVYIFGTFTMDGGTISGNSAKGAMGGGGVFVISGFPSSTFIMEGGTISGNSTNNYGGGVNVWGGTFTMEGGIISGNSASSGGGVWVHYNDFNKINGTTYGNDATLEDKNTAKEGNTYGHAVYFSNNFNNYGYYRDTTLGEIDNISTASELPANVGETLNNWTKRFQ